MARTLLLLLLVTLAGCQATGPAALNELVASNTTGLTDTSGDTPDWVELANTSSSEVDLTGWFLSDDAGNPNRHALDGLTLPADGYLILLASGDTTLGGDHLPFKLSAEGEQLVLSSPDGIVDAVNYGPQEADVAYARLPDGDGEWAAATPTPGAANE